MMKLKVFNIVFSFLLITNSVFAQNKVYGIVSSDSNKPLANVELYDSNSKLLSITNENGYYSFNTDKRKLEIIFFALEYNITKIDVDIDNDLELNQFLSPVSLELNSVDINERKKYINEIRKLKDIEETAIYAAKKTEVVVLSNSTANIASNNSRQIYSKISGLNIYQNDDAGIQMHIGGRGLDPNRTANFNTRQNGYDISADVLGYPESYYTPPSEGLEEVRIIRGAASLQYGTQFGGLVDFIIKKPRDNDDLKITSRNTIGSNNLYTNFTSLKDNSNSLGQYAFFNYKRGDGFRPNSNFESSNLYYYFQYKYSMKTYISGELTYLKYLAKQAGGLTDNMFNNDPFQSNRSRNWFGVNWLLYNVKFFHAFSDFTEIYVNYFVLDASRSALGFRTNRVDQIDVFEERDLIVSNFNNHGLETRFLSEFNLFNLKSSALLGLKLYNSDNTSQQGPGSNNSDADFNFYSSQFPYYTNQSYYKYPNHNTAMFFENILYIDSNITIVPGVRYEYIKTSSIGNYKKINLDGANNVIFDTLISNSRNNQRSFFLFGLGFSYKGLNNHELYSNISQNYRSVTFADISIINPAYSINPNIKDENGYTFDIGLRGRLVNSFYYNINYFNLYYNNRIGFVQRVTENGNVKSERGNVGVANIYGLESLIEHRQNIKINKSVLNLMCFSNISIINSEYIESEENGVVGNAVEFVPNVNVKNGFSLQFNSIVMNIQHTYLSSQFTDASNAVESNISGVIGEIPSYEIYDFSISYKYNKLIAEYGINNFMNTSYFTRRATGYPGPGIITSPNRNYYLTLGIEI